MLLGRVLEIGGGAHQLQSLVVLALRAGCPRRRCLLLDVHLLGPVGLMGGDECGTVTLQLLRFRPCLGRVAAASGADRTSKGRDRLRPSETVPREDLGGGAERGCLAPVMLLEGNPRPDL